MAETLYRNLQQIFRTNVCTVWADYCPKIQRVRTVTIATVFVHLISKWCILERGSTWLVGLVVFRVISVNYFIY
jgi:hypothetical protein